MRKNTIWYPTLIAALIIVILSLDRAAFAGSEIFCIDRDNDGYGTGAAYVLGPDADDDDVKVNTAASMMEKYQSLESFLKHKGHSFYHIIYISTQGSDLSGKIDDINHPFATWEKVKNIVKPGDTIVYRQGEYGEIVGAKNLSGLKEAPISFLAFPGERVVFKDCGDSGNTAAIDLKGAAHIRISGFIFDNLARNGQGNGVYLNGNNRYDWHPVNDIAIDHIEVSHTKSGVRAMENIHNVVVEDCVLHDTSSHNIYFGTRDKKIPNSDIRIQRNLLYKGAWKYDGRFGFQHNGRVDGMTIESNICHSNQTGGGISLVNGTVNAVVRNNLIFNNAKMGIQLYGYGEGPKGFFDNNRIYNNTIWVGRYNVLGEEKPKDHAGILFHDSSGRFDITGTVIKNNIIVTQEGHPVDMVQETIAATTKIENNIFYRDGGESVIKIGEDTYPLGKIQKKERLVRDNFFKHPGVKRYAVDFFNQPSLFDFDILSRSPAVGLGAPVNLKTDILGRPRKPDRIDVGCFAFDNDNLSPGLDSAQEKVFYIDEVNRFEIKTKDANTDNLTFKCINPPVNTVMTGDIFQWKPAPEQKGTVRLLFVVSNGKRESRFLLTGRVMSREEERLEKEKPVNDQNKTSLEPNQEKRKQEANQGSAAVQNGKGRHLTVSSLAQIRSAVKTAQPGSVILIAPGIYKGGFSARDIQGTRQNPITITGSDPQLPPVFTGKGEAVKFSRVAFIKLRNIQIREFSGNGINIDDGGDAKTPSHHIILENIHVQDIGAKGNVDAVKFSGVDHFLVTDCKIEGWGGSGIDMVGCHRGIIQKSRFEGLPGFRTKNALQIKGGSRQILVQTCAFINCGERAINLGGNTGLAYFRPVGADYEAQEVIVAGNKFVGGEAQLAWVTSQKTHVHNNIFYLPEKFVGRILQESKDARFVSCREGLFEANLVVTDNRLRTWINVGSNTKPETFAFLSNAWYRFNSEELPDLPTKEINGIYNLYPDLLDFGTDQMRIGSTSEVFKGIGPDAYSPWKVEKAFEDILLPEIKTVVPPSSKTDWFSLQLVLIAGIGMACLIIVAVRRVKKK